MKFQFAKVLKLSILFDKTDCKKQIISNIIEKWLKKHSTNSDF